MSMPVVPDVTPVVPGAEVVDNPQYVLTVAQSIFKGVWDLCLHTEFPGLHVSIAAVTIALLLIRLSIKVFGYLTGFGVNGGDYGRAATGLEKLKNDRQKAMEGKKSKLDW